MRHDSIPLPPTAAQYRFACRISLRLKEVIPPEAKADRRALSQWISRRKPAFETTSAHAEAAGATPKQVAFAERIARAKRRAIPEECFRSAALMSSWIDRNK